MSLLYRALNNAHNTIFIDVLDTMKINKLENVLLVGGGIIPKDDASKLENLKELENYLDLGHQYKRQ